MNVSREWKFKYLIVIGEAVSVRLLLQSHVQHLMEGCESLIDLDSGWNKNISQEAYLCAWERASERAAVYSHPRILQYLILNRPETVHMLSYRHYTVHRAKSNTGVNEARKKPSSLFNWPINLRIVNHTRSMSSLFKEFVTTHTFTHRTPAAKYPLDPFDPLPVQTTVGGSSMRSHWCPSVHPSKFPVETRIKVTFGGEGNGTNRRAESKFFMYFRLPKSATM